MRELCARWSLVTRSRAAHAPAHPGGGASGRHAPRAGGGGGGVWKETQSEARVRSGGCESLYLSTRAQRPAASVRSVGGDGRL